MTYVVEKYVPLAPLLSREQLEAVVSTFYDRVYAHPWIGRFFARVDQRIQEFSLVLFIEASWDDRAYPRRQMQYMRAQHAHVLVTDALFDLRQALFAEALRHHGHDDGIVEAFLHFNERWRPMLVKSSIAECSDAISEILAFPPPAPGPGGGGLEGEGAP